MLLILTLVLIALQLKELVLGYWWALQLPECVAGIVGIGIVVLGVAAVSACVDALSRFVCSLIGDRRNDAD